MKISKVMTYAALAVGSFIVASWVLSGLGFIGNDSDGVKSKQQSTTEKSDHKNPGIMSE